MQKTAGGVRSGKTRVTTAALMTDLHDYYDHDDALSETLAQDQMTQIRTALDLVLGQDRASFGTGPFSPTLTHRKHSTTDPSDMGTGLFMAEMLAACGATATIEALRTVLDQESDNIYRLTAPLLHVHTADGAIVTDDLGSPPSVRQQMAHRVSASPLLGSLHHAFETLARYSQVLEKTTFLQHVVLLGSAGLFLHVINAAQREDHDAAGLVPLLFCSQRPSPILQETSRSTVARARQHIERAFEQGLAGELRKRGEDALSPDDYRAWMHIRLPHRGDGSPDARKDDQAWTRFNQDFDAFLLGGATPFAAFCQAATHASFVVMTESPEMVAQSLGRLCGLVYPRQQGRGDKYYLPAPQVLDMLVFALIEPHTEITLEEFWDRAAQRFGIICGARGRTDMAYLSAWGVQTVPPAHLARNSRALLTELIRMGHVHEYADDIAMIRAGGMRND